jgi:hypothetical protein
MNEKSHFREALIQEIARYLAAVDLFRAEHCEPTWRVESTPWRTMVACSRASAEPAPSAH